MDNPSPNDLLNMTQARQYLGVSAPTFYRMLDRKELTFVTRPGGVQRMFRRADIDALISKSMTPRSDSNA